jgi:hypothetical protein
MTTTAPERKAVALALKKKQLHRAHAMGPGSEEAVTPCFPSPGPLTAAHGCCLKNKKSAASSRAAAGLLLSPA